MSGIGSILSYAVHHFFQERSQGEQYHCSEASQYYENHEEFEKVVDFEAYKYVIMVADIIVGKQF
jgi:hypothetical protein